MLPQSEKTKAVTGDFFEKNNTVSPTLKQFQWTLQDSLPLRTKDCES